MGRYMARAYLTEREGIRALVPLDVAKRGLEGTPYEIKKDPPGKGFEADWIGLDNEGLVIAEAKGSYDDGAKVWSGPYGRPQKLKTAIDQAERTAVFVRHTGKKLPAKRWAIASRWGTERTGRHPTLLAWDPEEESLPEADYREFSRIFLRADVDGVLTGMGHRAVSEVPDALGLPPQFPEVLIRAGSQALEPGLAAAVGPFGVQPLRDGDDVAQLEGVRELNPNVVVASLSSRYIANALSDDDANARLHQNLPAEEELDGNLTFQRLATRAGLTVEPLAELRVREGFSFSVSSTGQALGLIGGHWGRFLILLSCQTTESGGTTPMALREILSSYWSCFQALLFPQLEETIGALGERHQRFVMVLEWVRVETLLPYQHRRRGCPPSDRAALARAFIAKAVFALVSTRMLLDRLRHDSTLRRLCGWRSVKHIPSEATFSRAFAEFADSALPSRLHEALIKRTQGERLTGHISRDSTAIEGRERPTPKAPQPAKPKRGAGRPRKGEERLTEPRRLERQRNMTLPEMLADLPYACDIGVKRDAKGYQTSWSGYKLHIDAADGAIPVSCLLTSASLHDSQVAIPLATLTAERVRNLYDLMDSAYDAPEIRAHSRALGHVAIIDVNPRSGARKQALRQERQARRACGLVLSEERRYHERSTVERVNGRLKDEFGGRSVRVRGHAKVLCHLMFGIVALTVDQLMRLVT